MDASENVEREYSEALKKETEKSIKDRKKIVNRRLNIVNPRKYHMTDSQMVKKKKLFNEEVKDVDLAIKKKAGKKFFNPFRRAGIYYACVQALYLRGCNEWHEYIKVYEKISEVMTRISNQTSNSWSKFVSRSPRNRDGVEVLTAKDDEGRIKQNMRVLQRLHGLHPYGFKLMQVCSCIDIRKEKDGKYYFRLNTRFKDIDSVKPLYQCNYRKPRKKKEKGEDLTKEVLAGVLGQDG